MSNTDRVRVRTTDIMDTALIGSSKQLDAFVAEEAGQDGDLGCAGLRRVHDSPNPFPGCRLGQ